MQTISPGVTLHFGRRVDSNPKVLGNGPLSSSIIQNTMRQLAGDWGIPRSLLPRIQWEEAMVGRGGSAIDENRISLSSALKPEQALTILQHELHHHFQDVYLATIPMEQLLPTFNEAFTETIRSGRVSQVPVLDELGICQGIYTFPPLDTNQREQFATAIKLILGAVAQEGKEYSFTVPDEAHQALGSMISGESALDAKQAGTLLNTVLTRYIDCRNGLIHSPKLNGFREHPDASRIRRKQPFSNDDLVRTYYLRNEANLVMLQQYDPQTLKGEPQSMLTYYFTRGEARARMHEETLFTRLANQVDRCEAAGKLPGNPHILDLWKQQVFYSRKRLQTLEAGEKSVDENPLATNLQRLQEARELSEDETRNQPRQELSLYEASDKPQRQAILKEKREWREYTRDFLKTLNEKLPTLEEGELRQTVLSSLKNYGESLRETEAFLKLCGLLHRVSVKSEPKK